MASPGYMMLALVVLSYSWFYFSFLYLSYGNIRQITTDKPGVLYQAWPALGYVILALVALSYSWFYFSFLYFSYGNSRQSTADETRFTLPTFTSPICWRPHVQNFQTANEFGFAFVFTAMETVGKAQRMKPGVLYQAWPALGYMMLALVAYFIRDFRYLQLFTGLISLVFLPYWW